MAKLWQLRSCTILTAEVQKGSTFCRHIVDKMKREERPVPVLAGCDAQESPHPPGQFRNDESTQAPLIIADIERIKFG